jgi:hypothetical protein
MLTEALPELHHYTPSADHDSLPLADRMHAWVREGLCGLSGHDLMLQFDRGHRVYLRCLDCGHETPGWHIK